MLHDVRRRRWRRLAAVTLGTALAAAAAPAAVQAAPAGSGCPAADSVAANVTPRALRAALMCLVNRERAVRGLPPLRRSRPLARAARRHARAMVRRRFFAHQRSGGPDVGARVRRAGWNGAGYGETIAYGCGSASTPRTAVRMWMASPGHRVLLLDRGYDRAGPGVARRAPLRCSGGATWVLDLGAA